MMHARGDSVPSFKHDRVTPAQIIILGFLLLIFTGAVLLMLPFSTQEPGGASFGDALFTATSATCVTGLVLHDTALYWSPFGQLVILLLSRWAEWEWSPSRWRFSCLRANGSG